MRTPQLKAFIFFFGMLGVGYALAFPIATGILQAPLNLVTFFNMTAFAFLLAVIATVWLDKPLELDLFKWTEWAEKKAKAEKQEVPAQPVAAAQVIAEPQAEPQQQAAEAASPEIVKGALFPHERPTEHWNIDFGNSKQTYEGTDLPVWILAGWAVFIIWGVVYLISGLPGAF